MRETIDIGDPSGGRLAALAFGPADRPLDAVFLHANGFNALTYQTLLKPLASGLRLLAYDQRGHGRTTLPANPEGRRDWCDLAGDLAALLDRLSGPPVTLVGHSMGGTAALLAAARRPARVHSLVLLDPVIPAREQRGVGHAALAEQALRRRQEFPSRTEALKAYKGRGAFRTWPHEAVADYVTDGFAEEPNGRVRLACQGAWEASNYMAQGHDGLEALDRLACPAGILRAEAGSSCHLIEGRPPDVTVETLPGTTHFLPFEAQERVQAAIRRAVGPC